MDSEKADPAHDIAILLLAAGASSRMLGQDKLAKMLGGVPLLRVMASRAAATGASAGVFVTLSPDHPERLDLLGGLAVTPALVPDTASGLSESLKAGISALPDCAAFMILLADLPALRVDDLRTVMQARLNHPEAKVWRAATVDGKPGHPILCDAALRGTFGGLTGDQGGDAVLSTFAADTHLVRFADNRALLDLDTPEDWAAWEKAAPATAPLK